MSNKFSFLALIFVIGCVNSTPPDNGTVTPPDNDTLTPPDTGTVTPPDTGTVTPPDGGTVTPPDGGTVTPPDGGPVASPHDAWVMRSCGIRCAEFNPAYLACALAGTCDSLTSVDQIAALIVAAPSEARLVGQCGAVSPTVTGWAAASNVQATLHKDSTTGWYRVDGGLNGQIDASCNVSFIAIGCQTDDSNCWQQSGTAPLSDLNSHTGGPGMYCLVDNQGNSTGCALRFFLNVGGVVDLDGTLPDGP